ncbi:MAG: DUF4139 domain-containing protein [Desulfoplanes sp.]
MTCYTKKTVFAIMGLLIVAMTIPPSGRATPYQVTLFPDAAKIYEQGSIKLVPTGQSHTGTIVLPSKADPSTLVIVPPSDMTVQDISQEKTSSIDSQKLAGLKQELANLENKIAEFQAHKRGITARIIFWESRSTTHEASLEKLEKIASTMSAEIQKAMLDVDQTDLELKKALEKRTTLKNSITAIQGNKRYSWKISLGFAPGKQQQIACSWSYEVQGCGWTPLYRLNARPKEKIIQCTWKANIHQSTGENWRGVHLSLATGMTHRQSSPPSIRPWILQPVRPFPVDSSRTMMKEADVPRTSLQRVQQMANQSPVKKEKGTYALWDLGTRDIAAGEPVQILIKKQTWPAHFSYTIRPSVSTLGFLHAAIAFPQAVDFPQGKGLFLVDGALLGKRHFSFSGKEIDLFFGPEPQVTAKVILHDKKSGKSGVFAKKKTWRWNWDLIITNNKTIPISIQVEEPKPSSRDKDIALTIVTKPDFTITEDPQIMAWPLELKPQSSKTISLHVDALAPSDMDVDPGWRW